MEFKELKNMKKEDLAKHLNALRESLRDLRFKVHSKEVKNNHHLRTVRKEIAQILTILKAEK